MRQDGHGTDGPKLGQAGRHGRSSILARIGVLEEPPQVPIRRRRARHRTLQELPPHVVFGQSRREALSVLTLAMSGARTTNLRVLECERRAATVLANPLACR